MHFVREHLVSKDYEEVVLVVPFCGPIRIFIHRVLYFGRYSYDKGKIKTTVVVKTVFRFAKI